MHKVVNLKRECIRYFCNDSLVRYINVHLIIK